MSTWQHIVLYVVISRDKQIHWTTHNVSMLWSTINFSFPTSILFSCTSFHQDPCKQVQDVLPLISGGVDTGQKKYTNKLKKYTYTQARTGKDYYKNALHPDEMFHTKPFDISHFIHCANSTLFIKSPYCSEDKRLIDHTLFLFLIVCGPIFFSDVMLCGTCYEETE